MKWALVRVLWLPKLVARVWWRAVERLPEATVMIVAGVLGKWYFVHAPEKCMNKFIFILGKLAHGFAFQALL